jgi:hypothetical protein
MAPIFLHFLLGEVKDIVLNLWLTRAKFLSSGTITILHLSSIFVFEIKCNFHFYPPCLVSSPWTSFAQLEDIFVTKFDKTSKSIFIDID